MVPQLIIIRLDPALPQSLLVQSVTQCGCLDASERSLFILLYPTKDSEQMFLVALRHGLDPVSPRADGVGRRMHAFG